MKRPHSRAAGRQGRRHRIRYRSGSRPIIQPATPASKSLWACVVQAFSVFMRGLR